MSARTAIRFRLPALALALLLAAAAPAATRDLGNGFAAHGVCAPVSIARGITSAIGPEGREVLLAQLIDFRGAYGVLRLDLESGRCDFAEVPFAPSMLHGVFAAMYSPRHNRFYAHHSGRFLEYDPVAGRYSMVGETHPGMAMSLTEDDQGVIWAVTFPDCGVVSFDPASRRLTDHGTFCREDFLQYARTAAADDRGWIYFGYGNAAGQLAGLHPDGRHFTVLPEAERKHGSGLVFRATDGRVYGTFAMAPQFRSTTDLLRQLGDLSGRVWYELYDGRARRLDAMPQFQPVEMFTGTQEFVRPDFPSGARLTAYDLPGRTLRIAFPDGREREYPLAYPGGGAHLVSIGATAGGTVSGGTSFPMSNFVYDPAADTMTHRNGAVQWNVVLPRGSHFFVAAYNGGYLLDWRTDAPYDLPGEPRTDRGNPRLLGRPARPQIGRPHALAATPDGRYLLMGGTPGYGLTGGGLMIFDRETGEQQVIPHDRLVPDQAIHALAVTPDGRVFGGTTINAGTGGKVLAGQAALFEFDLKTRRLLWSRPLEPATRTCFALTVTPDGDLLGVADGKRIFRFDPRRGEIVARGDTGKYGPVVYQQGPRFFQWHDGRLWLLAAGHILELDPATCRIVGAVAAPVRIEAGGAIQAGRLYFGAHGALYSWKLPEKTPPR